MNPRFQGSEIWQNGRWNSHEERNITAECLQIKFNLNLPGTQITNKPKYLGSSLLYPVFPPLCFHKSAFDMHFPHLYQSWEQQTFIDQIFHLK